MTPSDENSEKILVIGSGGREHALVRALLRGSAQRRVLATPGNAGIAGDIECVTWPVAGSPSEMTPSSCAALAKWAKESRFDLVVIGPEVPLAAGLSDALFNQGVLAFGPMARGARLESSKLFGKEILHAAGVRTARYERVTSTAELEKALSLFQPPYVLKADGLAAGKGVVIAKSREELLQAGRLFFDEKVLGEAAQDAFLEEFTTGEEVSHLILTDGHRFVSLPSTRDHKRLRDGDEGPNTGGMGTVAPVPLSDDLIQRIETEAVSPVLQELAKRGIEYRGILYFGLMLQTDPASGAMRPSVLEFNVRFGDPEAQVILPLLDGDWGQVFRETASGRCPSVLKWIKNRAAVCVVLASSGYPDSGGRGDIIPTLDEKGRVRGTKLPTDGSLLHAGTTTNARREIVVSGGRVLNAVGEGKTLSEARTTAYAVAELVRWPGCQLRTDIANSVTAKAFTP